MFETDEHAPQDPKPTNDASPTPTGAGNPGSPEAEPTVSMSQKRYNQLLAERAEQAKRALLAEMGLAPETVISDVKAKLSKATEIEQANLTAAERIQKDLDAAQKRAELAEKQLETDRAALRSEVVESSLRAAIKGVPDEDLVLLYAQKHHADAMTALIGDDHKLDKKKLDALVDTVKKEKPLLFQVARGGATLPSNSGGTAKPGDKPKVDPAKLPGM